MNGVAWQTLHNENILQSCQDCCFNGLIPVAITVNTSQARCLEDSVEVVWCILVSYDHKIKMTEPRSEENEEK